MYVEIGHFALNLALALAIYQAIVPLWGAYKRDYALMTIAPSVAVVQFLCVLMSFMALTYAHVSSDFSVVNVIENSHSTKPLIYKISGVWGSHEGSMLLWVLILEIFSALLVFVGRDIPLLLKSTSLAVQSWITAAFLIFILTTSNPFARVISPPMEGQDLNPLLQDPGLAIHPPLLYMGYVGFSMAFSFAAAALINGNVNASWARYVRPWILCAWIFLTLGIAMGSYWAYYTLGWGGFWFWDPVENASLMPWLAGTALLHSVIVMEKREALKIWTLFLAILAFSLSLLGTFLVRSGVLTSVHAFANDPSRGIFILLILIFFIGGSLILFALRAPMLKSGGLFAPVSREGLIVINNLILSAACATVLIGTLYPLALEALTGEKISVGAPFFNITLIPLFIPIFIFMPIAQMMPWKRGNLISIAQRLLFAYGVGLFVIALAALIRGQPLFVPIAMGLAVYLIIGSCFDVYERLMRANSLQSLVQRALWMPLSVYGTSLAHIGVGVTLFGLAATAWGVEQNITLRAGDQVDLGPYHILVQAPLTRSGPNFDELILPIDLRDGARVIAHLEPARRSFKTRQMQTTEAGIYTINFGQIYISLADENAAGGYDARLYWKPFVTFIWIGALIMACGGCLSFADRRGRVALTQKLKSEANVSAEIAL
jgi:cytochrome c-type biogenesis protein CcmF